MGNLRKSPSGPVHPAPISGATIAGPFVAQGTQTETAIVNSANDQPGTELPVVVSGLPIYTEDVVDVVHGMVHLRADSNTTWSGRAVVRFRSRSRSADGTFGAWSAWIAAESSGPVLGYMGVSDLESVLVIPVVMAITRSANLEREYGLNGGSNGDVVVSVDNAAVMHVTTRRAA